VSPQTPIPELGFKTLEQTNKQTNIPACKYILTCWYKTFPGENSVTDLGHAHAADAGISQIAAADSEQYTAQTGI
jgi:hypothetical protein